MGRVRICSDIILEMTIDAANGMFGQATQVSGGYLSILGLPAMLHLSFADKVVGKLNASCIFVLDAGDQGPLAIFLEKRVV